MALDSGSPGFVSPSRGRVLRKRVTLGCWFLGIKGLTPEETADVEATLMGSCTSDDFVEAIGQAEDGSGLLTDEKALFLWDIYKMI